MNDGEIVRALAEALRGAPAPSGGVWPMPPLDIAAILLPTVRRVVAKELTPFRELFAGGPDTICRTTWRRDSLADMPGTATECCEVPVANLHEALTQTKRYES